ncbi:hypothetical protein SCP_0309290 [Sparassis crispa]|uniref:Uncharacterized protein n=1 Tax=Sparassis crispa TaxID=139825 RepID=A0A401GGA7_9APHY|nr:hypothetical protein SCP_0309290 [Sparassis crispa]GBE81202.1 hypothetical protein SCP_0309290 [Sparassis crispa]
MTPREGSSFSSALLLPQPKYPGTPSVRPMALFTVPGSELLLCFTSFENSTHLRIQPSTLSSIRGPYAICAP